MPSTIRVKVVEARRLPIMDRKSGLTDAYVEVRFGTWNEKTQVVRKTLEPVWNHLFRVQVLNDAHLQDLPLELHVLDKDTYSSDDSIGIVLLDLNSLLVSETGSKSPTLSGWFPIYDSLRGISGHLHVQLSLQFFGDSNPFKESSAGVLFISSRLPLMSPSYRLQHMDGLVEELLCEADPEFAWMDSFRTPRVSNEARQLLFHKLSREVKRSIGTKVLERGCNAVLGYRQRFDLEEESSSIIASGYGTACRLSGSGLGEDEEISSSSDSDRHKDIPLLTTEYCEYPLFSVGGVLSSRSVKVLPHREADRELRDEWWNELREELVGHCRSLQCNAVLGYKENLILHGDVCILSVEGTAVCTVEDSALLSEPCKYVHVPYNCRQMPFQVKLGRCSTCKEQSAVPEIVMATINPPQNLERSAESLITATVVREKPRLQGGALGTQLSEMIPFLEFELHRQLLAKLRTCRGEANALFGVTSNIQVGDSFVIASASATAMHLNALGNEGGLRNADSEESFSSLNGPEEPKSEAESKDSREMVVMDIDEAMDMELLDRYMARANALPANVRMMNTQLTNGMRKPLFFLTAVKRLELPALLPQNQAAAVDNLISDTFQELFLQVWERLASFGPCSLNGLETRLSFPEHDHEMLQVVMMVSACTLEPSPQDRAEYNSIPQPPVIVSSLAHIPGKEVDTQLGHLQFLFIRESLTNREEGGMELFAHLFVVEVLAICRAHVLSRGGNALLNLQFERISLTEAKHHQLYGIISVSGDVVHVYQ